MNEKTARIRKIGHDLRQIAGPVFLLALFLLVIDHIYSGRGSNLFSSFKVIFLNTFSCAFYCSLFFILLFEKIHALPRPVFFVLFTLLAGAGVFLGNVTAFFILEGRLRLPINTLIISFATGLIFSAAISAYFVTRGRLEQKIARVKEIELENEKLKRLDSEARLSDLRAKLNPHFLFNVLNTTAALIYDDPVKAENSILRLSGLYRRVLSLSGQAFVRAGEELDLVEDYLELEKLRFDDRLSYEISCPEELKEVRIPGLLIEPLVENAVKHNQNESARKIRLSVRIEESRGNLLISVSDNGRGFDVQRTGSGFGLFSIQERLRLHYGHEQAFDIESGADRGTHVRIRIPKEQPCPSAP